MKPFEYVTARSAQGAVDLCGKKGRYIAGGTDLLGEMKDFIATPSRLVDLKSLPESDRIEENASYWRIGANVRIAALADHDGLGRALPGVAEAASRVGSPQIRNMATVGGNLAQHSRCWYYRHRDVQCLKNGGSRCYARESENRYHSLFSGNPCISPIVSNLAVIFTALEGTATVLRGNRSTQLTMPELYRHAWFNPYAHNSLEPGDLLTEVRIPKSYPTSAYRQVTEKADFDWALVSCAVAGRVYQGSIYHPRIVLGAVSNIPHMVEEAHRFLEGKLLSEKTAERAAQMVLAEAQPQQHNGYKVPLAHALVKRALLGLVS